MRTALVLSGGGARGAYEAGVLSGLMEVLGPRSAPFQVLTGTSIGAVNGAWLAAHADRADMGVEGLVAQWRSLRLDETLRLRRARELPRAVHGHAGWSLLDVAGLERIVVDAIPWDRLHRNVETGRLRALAVACLEISTGRTAVFAELGPGVGCPPSADPRRVTLLEPVGPQHVLASAALPFLFPARKVGAEHYADGGLRFNTPLSPAIRLGADRLVVITLLNASRAPTRDERAVQSYPSPMFLAGKMLNALLLDPVVHDLQVLEQFNRLLAVLERAVAPEAMAEVRQVLQETRGAPYRRVRTLVFQPSQDIGRIAAEHAAHVRARRPATLLLSRLLRVGASWEADLASFLLFDRGFVDRLIALGRSDALARSTDIRGFFAA